MNKPATTLTAKIPETTAPLHRIALLLGIAIWLCVNWVQPARALQIDSAPCSDDRLIVQGDAARLVVIIDDLGHNLRRGKDALNLPGKLNYAIIPYTPHAKLLAKTALAKRKELLLHTPMSTVTNTDLGRGGLTPQLSREEFRATLKAALDAFPEVAGINNHMGSQLTQQRMQMAWVMQELRGRDLYFVDSRTSANSVAATVASEFKVPNLSRHIFLDNDKRAEAIDARFQQAIKRAHQEGFTVVIGHPYPETIDYLRDALPALAQSNTRLALVSEVLEQHVLKAKQLTGRATAAEIDSHVVLPPGCSNASALPAIPATEAAAAQIH